MNKQEMDATLALEEINKQAELEKEFEKLRPSPWRGLFLTLSGMVGMAFYYWLFPALFNEPAMIALLLLVFGISGEIYRESIAINKRIDLLYKILKKEH